MQNTKEYRELHKVCNKLRSDIVKMCRFELDTYLKLRNPIIIKEEKSSVEKQKAYELMNIQERKIFYYDVEDYKNKVKIYMSKLNEYQEKCGLM